MLGTVVGRGFETGGTGDGLSIQGTNAECDLGSLPIPALVVAVAEVVDLAAVVAAVAPQLETATVIPTSKARQLCRKVRIQNTLVNQNCQVRLFDVKSLNMGNSPGKRSIPNQWPIRSSKVRQETLPTSQFVLLATL